MTTKAYILEDNQRAVIHTLLTAELAKQKKFTPWLSQLTDTFANEHLVEDEPRPACEHPMFTDEDKQRIFDAVWDEANDMSSRERAEQMLPDVDLTSCVGYVFEDATEVANMLQHLANDEDTYVNGEFLREHDEDGDDYAGKLDEAKRLRLINDDETELTDLGREFVATFAEV